MQNLKYLENILHPEPVTETGEMGRDWSGPGADDVNTSQ